MINVSSVRLSIPKAATKEIIRKELVAAVASSQKKLAYIHAGAGYGKTTLLSQVANSMQNTVWLTLDGESDVFTFLNILSKAIQQTFPNYEFTVSEYLPFEEKSNFITIIANAFICSIEKLEKDIMIILEDLHTIEEQQIRKLITCIMKYKPQNIRFYLSSREAPWQQLIPFRVRGDILELTQKELAFTRDEVIQVLGFDDLNIYSITEGWPLAICSFKVLLENDVSIADLPSRGNESLYSYLFYECISRLPSEMVDFLKASVCFEELDPQLLNTILRTKNAKLLLESLVAQNLFTIKTSDGQYRYHTLFRDYLMECTEDSQALSLQNTAANYYFDKKMYSKAAEYATRLENKEMLEQIILISYKDYIKSGSFSELRMWFHTLGDATTSLSRELLVAKGALLSSIGNFTAAKKCLDTVIPLLKEDNHELYIEAIVHKARVLRNFISFEVSNKLLDELIAKLDNIASELSYTVVIEKIYNLCWNSQISEAYALTYHMIETCAMAGDVKVKSWFERYLTAIHFFAGRMKDAVDCYEKFLELPEDERKYLDLHNIGIYAAKAYQMLGDQQKAVSIISTELHKLRSTGRYEELWAGYLLAAEIHYQNAFIDRMNGGSQTFETAVKYFTLADEYAPLYRNSEFQMQWAKMQRLVSTLTFADGSKEDNITQILANLDNVGDYLKTIVIGRLFSFYISISDFPSVVKYASLSIKIGEKSNIMMIPTIAYGILAKAAITMKDTVQAIELTNRFLKLCSQNGIYEYFRIKKTYGSILEFALDNGIECSFTKQMMEFAGYKIKKVYITTLGGFSVSPYKDKQEPLKMRTKKERELFAFLLDSGIDGVTKEQIYNAIWSESESDDIKKLIGVNLAQIKKDLESLGVENPVINLEKHYNISKNEIVLDIDLFEEAIENFRLQKSDKAAQKILSLYKGEYLADFEAHWAVSKRIRYRKAYDEALDFSGNL